MALKLHSAVQFSWQK